MDTTPTTALILAAAGVGTGVLGALLGTGGGVILIPLLMLGFGVPIHYAIGTSILSVIATSSAVASANVERGTANMRLGMTLETATSLGAIAGGVTAGWLRPHVLEMAFGLVIIPTAVLMWRAARRDEGGDVLARSPANSSGNSPEQSREPASRPATGWLGGSYLDPKSNTLVVYSVQRLWAGLAVAFVAGNLSGLLGIGGGVFKVPALNLLCAVPIRAAAATSNFMIGVTAAASAFLYYGRGEIEGAMTAAVVLGVVVGSIAGTYLNPYLSGPFVKRLFAILLLAVAGQMLIRALTGKV